MGNRPGGLAEALDKGLKIPWKGVRPDLILHKGAPVMGDRESWILEDPVRGTHYELGEADARFFLCLVAEPDLRSAVSRLLATTSLRPTAADVLSFVQMLQQEKLAILPSETAIHMAGHRETARPPLWRRVITGYLFVKIPLFRPQRFLDRVGPWLRPLWSTPFLYMYGVMGLVGLVFAFQQAEIYWHTASRLFTPRGALVFLACLATVKTIHEFGHALAAWDQGQFVRRIGLAFMVFMPIFYTDVTDGWKLASRRSRMIIGAAGVLTEIVIAAVSLFFWSVLPDGPMRSLMFYFSGASILSTILVNLNPLMRFDGYYILMDYLRVSNLRTRSMQMFAWFRRRLLVGWKGPKPEVHPWERGLAWFGLFSHLYRIFIFFSITISIYHLVFKALGVVLVLLQIMLMVILPVTGEVLFLLKKRQYWGSTVRAFGSGVVLALLIAGLFVPIPSLERIPGLMVHPGVARLTAPGPGRIEGPIPEIGSKVQEGDLLVHIHDLFLEQEMDQVIYDLAQVKANLATIGAGGAQGGYRQWLLAEQKRLTATLEKVKQSLALLEVRAPVSGRVLDVNPHLANGSFVHYDAFLVAVGDDDRAEVRAYASERIYQNLHKKNPETAKIVFPDLETRPREGVFVGMQDFPVREMPNDALLDFAGGEIPSLQSPDGRVQPMDALYPVIFTLPFEEIRKPHGSPCYALLISGRRSLVERTGHWVWRTLASEGFV